AYPIRIRSPGCVPLAAAAPTGSSSTLSAPRTYGTRPVHGRTAVRTVTTSRSPSASGLRRKTASIAKRMNDMWMPFAPAIHRPLPSGSAARPIRPMNRAQNEVASSRSAATTVARVTFRALATAPGRIRVGTGLAARAHALVRDQVDDDQDDRRPEDDDEQR